MPENSIKHCTHCGEAFWIGKHDDYGDVLDHWASDHEDSEILWSILSDARTWTRCGGCGEMFPAEVDVVGDGLVVATYCDECADNGLEDKIKGLMVEDVTGRYVLDNEVCEEGVA
jgi:hypothetical protein